MSESWNTPPPYDAIGLWRAWEDPRNYYRDALAAAVEQAHSLRCTDGLALRYTPGGDPLTRFEDRFEGRQEALSLYAAAIQQVDFLSEYLGLYRLLEWPRRGNGKEFVEANLDELRDYNFGSLRMVDPGPRFTSPRPSRRVQHLTRTRTRTDRSAPDGRY